MSRVTKSDTERLLGKKDAQNTKFKEEVIKLKKTAEGHEKTIEGHEQTIEDLARTIEDRTKTIGDRAKTIEDQAKTIEDLARAIEDLTRPSEEQADEAMAAPQRKKWLEIKRHHILLAAMCFAGGWIVCEHHRGNLDLLLA